jgi:hypothetical protein
VVLSQSAETPKRKYQEKNTSVMENSLFLHHDNAPTHALLLIHDFLANMNTTVRPQPPYLPDLALADIFLFPKLKSTLKGQRFQMIQKITENFHMELCVIPKKVYQDYFQKWQQRWELCINEGEEYYEGDKALSVAGMSKKNYKK